MPDGIVNSSDIHSHNSSARVEAIPQRIAELHPAWQAMVRFCREIGYGEIALVKIHDGIPISAEVVTKKIRWY